MPTPAQQQLIDRATALLQSDPRIEAAWLAGSLGAGTGDEWSDVDLLVLVAEGTFAEASAAIAARVDEIAPTVLVNRVHGIVINAVTEDWQRFDISFTEASGLVGYNADRLQPLFNRSGHEPPHKQPEPPPLRVTALATEFLRILGLMPVVVGRSEYQLALTGQEHMRRLTFELFMDMNGVPVAERGGALKRNPLLTPDQRAALAALPATGPTREGAIAGNLAWARLFLPAARAYAAREGADWPDRLEAATRRRLAADLGVAADWD